MGRRRRTPPTSPTPSTKPTPTTPTEQLLDFTRQRVGYGYAARFAPGDPGYPDYVTALEALQFGGAPALTTDFDLTEAIALTRWTNARGIADEREFRRFRLFTSAAALALADRSDRSPPHYDLAALLVDTFALRDAGHGGDAPPSELLVAVCDEFIARQRDGSDGAQTSAFACVARFLIEGSDDGLDAAERSYLEKRAADERWLGELEEEPFVWGRTAFDQVNPVWWRLVERHAATGEWRSRLLKDGERWAKGRLGFE